MRAFILDDEIRGYRNPIVRILQHHNLTIATSCDQAKKIYNEPYGLLLLDHDMEGFYEESLYHNTGFRFVEWLVKQPMMIPKPEVILHSQNAKGRMNMKKELRKIRIEAEEIPYGGLLLQTIKDRWGK